MAYLTENSGTVIQTFSIVTEFVFFTSLVIFAFTLNLIGNASSFGTSKTISTSDSGTSVGANSVQAKFVFLTLIFFGNLLTWSVIVANEVFLDTDITVSEESFPGSILLNTTESQIWGSDKVDNRTIFWPFIGAFNKFSIGAFRFLLNFLTGSSFNITLLFFTTAGKGA